MLRPTARWKLKTYDHEAADRLASEMSLSPLIARLLAVRGIHDREQAERFLRPAAAAFHDPFSMKGMSEAVQRIRQAIAKKEKIRVYGDYDADGVSSTALLLRVLDKLGIESDYYIPHRASEGYGLNKPALDAAKQSGVTLLVTVDNGVSAVEEIAYGKEIGLDIIVTDHHEPPERLPEPDALINPKLPDCPYPFKQLAGVGVVLKLAQALIGDEIPEEWIQLAAIGTVADVMPLVDENRRIVTSGLSSMRRQAIPGLRALLDVAGVAMHGMNEGHIGFALGPRINASGRLASADHAVRLLNARHMDEAVELALQLDGLNKERQALVDQMLQEAMRIAEETGAAHDAVTVVAGEGWNPGVIGIVASRLLEKYYRPVVVLAVDKESGLAKGSARSIPGFDLYEALSECAHGLEHYGGHEAAAGMTVRVEHIDTLREGLCRVASARLTKTDYIPLKEADLLCDMAELHVDAARELGELAPFGAGNPPPRFIVSGVGIRELKTMGKESRHLKLVLQHHDEAEKATLEAVGFGKGDWSEHISPSSSIDVLGELTVNEWNGNQKAQLLLHDVRVATPQVFDWRGTGLASGRTKSWLAERSAASIQPDERENRTAIDSTDDVSAGIIVFSTSEGESWLKQFPEQTARLPVWEWDSDKQKCAPWNEAAERSTWQHVKEWLIPYLPPSVESFKSWLGRCEGLQSAYILFAPPKGGITLPSREHFKRIYTALLQQQTWSAHDRHALGRLAERAGLSPDDVAFIIRVFSELQFIRLNDEGMYHVIPSPGKQPLDASPAYTARLARQEAESIFLYSTGKQLRDWIIQALPNLDAPQWPELEEAL